MSSKNFCQLAEEIDVDGEDRGQREQGRQQNE
jgi:hypothetical protein